MYMLNFTLLVACCIDDHLKMPFLLYFQILAHFFYARPKGGFLVGLSCLDMARITPSRLVNYPSHSTFQQHQF